ncbi:MAG: alanine dehydrogenase [Thermoleophilia bacterium]|nr:alanine dehydrogenase [Thermoleophilia bacterium]
MKVGVVTEIKPDEYRVALTPAGAHELVRAGHEVVVQHGAGVGSQFADAEYEAVGAAIVTREAAWAESELLLKVKEPVADEPELLSPGQTLFTYLHLAPEPALTERLRASGATCIAYETVQTDDGRTPLLAPMSEVAGRLAPQVGAYFLEKSLGGRGILLGGVPGVKPAKVVVIGGGNVGYNAAKIAIGMGANVNILDRSIDRLRELEEVLDGRVNLIASTTLSVAEQVADADLVIGAVLLPGALAPRVVSREMLRTMQPQSVVVDVAIDQGGCFETSRATTHTDPVYVEENVLHYCVANMPGAVPITSTKALTNVTLPFVLKLASSGVRDALLDDVVLGRGANIVAGQVTSREVAEALELQYVPLADALGEVMHA